MAIIRLNKRHLEQLATIDLESNYQMEGDFRLSDYRRILKERFGEGHEIFFGCKEGGVLKGYATLKPFFPGYRHCELYWLAVRKRFQGRGIGTKLLRFIEDYARKGGFRKIFLYTNKAMKRARKFYESRGYRFVNEFPGYYNYKRNNTAVLYAKKL